MKGHLLLPVLLSPPFSLRRFEGLETLPPTLLHWWGGGDSEDELWTRKAGRGDILPLLVHQEACALSSGSGWVQSLDSQIGSTLISGREGRSPPHLPPSGLCKLLPPVKISALPQGGGYSLPSLAGCGHLAGSPRGPCAKGRHHPPPAPSPVPIRAWLLLGWEPLAAGEQLAPLWGRVRRKKGKGEGVGSFSPHPQPPSGSAQPRFGVGDSGCNC